MGFTPFGASPNVDYGFVWLILIAAGLVGLVVALFQTLVWARRARRADPDYDDRRY